MIECADVVFTREAFEAAGGLRWQSAALTDRARSIAVIAARGPVQRSAHGGRRLQSS